VAEPWLEHPRAFVEQAAHALGGRAVERPGLTGFVSSRHDRFLNQLFAVDRAAAGAAAEALEGRPGFVWPERELADDERFAATVVYGMTASISGDPAGADADVAEVRSDADLDGWHEVYCEVFGGAAQGRADWQRVHDALGPAGDDSLLLLLARVAGAPAATGGVFFHGGWAGLYWFTTRAELRGRGLASALVAASHEAARRRGLDRALLHATVLGRPVYAAAGYREVRALPLLVTRSW
jgi:GNAT superfamily N-acetyltransferase